MAWERIVPIVIDTREKTPLPISEPVIYDKLPAGDYGLLGFSDLTNPAFTIELKSLPDLCRSLGKDRDRFFREIELMRPFRFRALVIETSEAVIEGWEYPSLIDPHSLLASLDAMSVRAGVHVYWCGETSGAVEKVEALSKQFLKGIEKDFARLGDKKIKKGVDKIMQKRDNTNRNKKEGVET